MAQILGIVARQGYLGQICRVLNPGKPEVGEKLQGHPISIDGEHLQTKWNLKLNKCSLSTPLRTDCRICTATCMPSLNAGGCEVRMQTAV